jgi:hypothetical protein
MYERIGAGQVLRTPPDLMLGVKKKLELDSIARSVKTDTGEKTSLTRPVCN